MECGSVPQVWVCCCRLVLVLVVYSLHISGLYKSIEIFNEFGDMLIDRQWFLTGLVWVNRKPRNVQILNNLAFCIWLFQMFSSFVRYLVSQLYFPVSESKHLTKTYQIHEMRCEIMLNVTMTNKLWYSIYTTPIALLQQWLDNNQ